MQHCQDTQTEFDLLRESVSNQAHPQECMVVPFYLKKKPPKLSKSGRSLVRLVPWFTEDSTEKVAFSASQSGIGNKKSFDVAKPAHVGALVAATPRIPDMNQGAAAAVLLLEPLATKRFVEAASNDFFSALYDSENPTAQLNLQKKKNILCSRVASANYSKCRTDGPRLPARRQP